MNKCVIALRNKKIAYLAQPKKTRREKKYVYVDTESIKCRYLKIKRPVVPIKNKRIDMLAEPVIRNVTPKYMEPELGSTLVVSRGALESMCTPRLDHLSRPFVRVLTATRNDRKFLGKNYIDLMNERIATSLDTIYYHNFKSLRDIEAAKKKPPPKKPKYWDEVGDKDRMLFLSTPHKKRKPPPLPRRKRMKLEQLKPGIERLCIPNQVYKRPSQDSLVLRLRINPAALKYEASDRIKELNQKIPKRYVFVPIVVKKGWVSPGALTYEITERTKALAEPHARANAPEMDLKENPYDISPMALKYKATPRIIQLAKPVER